MQVTVESTSELERKLTVKLSEAAIKEKVETRLKKLSKDVKIDGFRPGKVPQRVIRSRYGKQLRQEVLAELTQSSFYDALVEKDLNLVGRPLITPEKIDEGEGFRYTASFEVYPEVALVDLSELSVTRPKTEMDDTDLESVIERLRTQKKTWEIVDRAAQNVDRVIINFTGSVNGENFTEGQVKEHSVILGSNQMISGFEDRLIGTAKNDLLNFDLDFPSDYHMEKLAGKTAHFEVEVVNVQESQLPELNEEFVKAFGIASGKVDDFRIDIKKNMEKELENTIRENVKTNVMDALMENHDIQLPKGLIDQEVVNMEASYKKAAENQNRNIQEQIPRETLEPQAIRRVKLGLVLGEIIKKNDLKPDERRVHTAIESIAQGYENPKEVVDWYYSEKEQLSKIEHMVLEDQVVEFVLERVQVTDKPIGFSELMQMDQSDTK